jgi:two-component system, NarL family, nitrate/nitrite response regulator NarL
MGSKYEKDLQSRRRTGTEETNRRPAVSVLIVCEVRVYREFMEAMLASHDAVSVTGSAPTLSKALEALRTTTADVVLVDATTAEAIEIIRAIAAELPASTIVAMGVAELVPEVLEVARAGAAAYIPREAGAPEIVAAIVSAANGEVVCPPRITAALLRQAGAHSSPGGASDCALTPRELEVLELVTQNLSNRQIAALLQIELSTVKTHVHNVLTKLNLRSRVETATWLHKRNGAASMAQATSGNGSPNGLADLSHRFNSQPRI